MTEGAGGQSGPGDPTRRARRLLRLYPARWRDRYGDEFTELLVDDITERPRSVRRSWDVAKSAVTARLAGAGLVYDPLDSGDGTRRSLASFAMAAAVFLGFGLVMWSQLNIGWRWSRPDTVATGISMAVMTAGLLGFTVLAAVAALGVAWQVALQVWHGGGRRLGFGPVTFVAAAAVVAIGGHHFQNGWPGTGGRPWAYHDAVPGGVAAFVWASTLSVTAYWAHPSALGAFPVAELVWMGLSPVAMVAVVAAAVRTVRRLEMPAGVLRLEAALSRSAAATLGLFLTGALIWVLGSGSGPADLYHAGVLDAVGLMTMAVATAVAAQASWMAASMASQRPSVTGR